MLSSAVSPLRRRIVRKGLLQKSAETFSGRRQPGATEAATVVRFGHSSSSADDTDEGHARYHSARPISIVPGSPTSSSLLRRTCSINLGAAAVADYILLPRAPSAQLRYRSSGPSRSSTSAAHPTGSFSSKAPTDEHADDDEHGHHEAHSSKLESAREKGRVVVKRGRAAAKTGAKVAKKGALSMRDMVKKYGWTAFGTYFTIYFATVGSLFAGIDTGVLDPASVMSALHWMHGSDSAGDAAEVKSTVEILAHTLEKWEWTKPYAETVEKNPHAANLGIAWLATKFTEPLRLMLTFAAVPRVHKALGKDPKDADEEMEEVEERDSEKK